MPLFELQKSASWQPTEEQRKDASSQLGQTENEGQKELFELPCSAMIDTHDCDIILSDRHSIR